MNNNIFYGIFIIMVMPEKVFQLISAFIFGCCFGYYMFKILRYKNQKEEIDNFFSNYNKQYGSQQCRFSCEKSGRS